MAEAKPNEPNFPSWELMGNSLPQMGRKKCGSKQRM